MSCRDEMSQKILAVLAEDHLSIPESPFLLFPILSSTLRSLSLTTAPVPEQKHSY